MGLPSLLWKTASFSFPASWYTPQVLWFFLSFIPLGIQTFWSTSTQTLPFHHSHECALPSYRAPSITSPCTLTCTACSVAGSFRRLSSYIHLWWLFPAVTLTILGMDCNPEIDSTPVIQSLRLEDTGFWSRSWGVVAKKRWGPGKVVHTFHLDHTFCQSPT